MLRGALVALVLTLVGCGGSGVGSDGTRTLETEGVQIRYPKSWHATAEPLTAVTWPAHRLAVASFSLGQDRPDGDCSPRTALERLGTEGAMLILLDYEQTAGADAPPRPRPFGLNDKARAQYECFGLAWNIPFQDAGRHLQAFAYLGSGADEHTREKLLEVLDSLRVEPQ